MDSIKQGTAKFENALEALHQPLKPWLPGIARFLLVVTFLEDSLRIVSQWEDQVNFISGYRQFPHGTATLFLGANVITMIICSVLAIMRKYTEGAVAGLFAVVVSQTIGYGLALDASFLFRSLSVIGGLLMLLADAYIANRRRLFAGVPTLNENEKQTYLQLGGRILLVFLFVSFIMAGDYSFLRMIVSIIGLIACIMVVVGFKAKYSAWVMITLLSISNVLLNNWWSLHHTHPHRDFLKYDFFQTLSIMGGFLLLGNLGPGGISVDEQKKSY